MKKRIVRCAIMLSILSACNRSERLDGTAVITEEPTNIVSTQTSTNEVTAAPDAINEPTTTLTATPSIPQARSDIPTPIPRLLPDEPLLNWTARLPDGAIERQGIGKINASSISPDGSYLAVATTLGVGIFAAATLDEVWFVRSPGALGSVEWSPDGSLLTVITDFPDSHLLAILDARTGSLQGEHRTAGDYGIDGIAWSPQSDRLAVASFGGLLVLGRNATMVQEMILPESESSYAGGALTVAWSPDGSMLAAGLEYSSPDVRVWSIPSGDVIADWTTDSEENLSVLAFSPDGTQLAAVAGWGRFSDVVEGEKRIFLWTIASDESLVLDGQDLHYRIGLEWNSDGRRLAVYGTSGIGEGAGEVSIWDLETQTEHEMLGISQPISDIEWSPDYTKLVAGGGNFYQATGEVSVWDSESGEMLLSYEPSELVHAAHWVDNDHVMAQTWKAVEVRNITSGQIVGVVHGSHYLFQKHWSDNQLLDLSYEPNLAAKAWSPSGSFVASLQESGWLTISDTATGQIVYEWQARDYVGRASMRLLWSPGETQLAIIDVSYLASLNLWDIASEHTIVEDLSGGRYTSAAFSPDGSQIVVEDIVYDAHSGQPIVQLNGVHFHIEGMPEDMYAAAWSPDGSLLALGSGEHGRDAPVDSISIAVWDTSAWQLLYTISGETVMTTSLAWSPDGRYLATGGGLPYGYEMFTPHELDDNRIALFDAETGTLIHIFVGHRDVVASLLWSPDSTKLASGSEDGEVFIWTISP